MPLIHQTFESAFAGGQLSLSMLRAWMRAVEEAVQRLGRLKASSPLQLITGPGGDQLAIDLPVWTIDTPEPFGADVNDWAPTPDTIQRISATAGSGGGGATAGVDLTGITRPPQDEGKLYLLWNVGVPDVTVVNQSSSSSAENRFLVDSGTNFALGLNEIAWAVYDYESLRWRVSSVASLGRLIGRLVERYLVTDVQCSSGTLRVTKECFKLFESDSCSGGSGSGSGSGDGPVVTTCCPLGVPRTLHATLVSESGCACLDGATLTLTFDGGSSWSNLPPQSLCGGSLSLTFNCTEVGWQLGAPDFTGFQDTFSCDPLSVTFTGVTASGIPGCTGTFSVTVTE